MPFTPKGKTYNSDGTETGYVPVSGNEVRPAGLVGPMPMKFTEQQKAQTLASLKANARPYLQTSEPGGVRHEVDGEYRGQGAGTDMLGAPSGGDRSAPMLYTEAPKTQTRAQSASERQSIASQIARSQEIEDTIVADRSREIARDKILQEQIIAADEAARKQAFYDQWGVDLSSATGTEILKIQGKEAKSLSIQKDWDTLNALEAAELAKLPIDPATGERKGAATIKAEFEAKRNARLLRDSVAGEDGGSALRELLKPRTDPFTSQGGPG